MHLYNLSLSKIPNQKYLFLSVLKFNFKNTSDCYNSELLGRYAQLTKFCFSIFNTSQRCSSLSSLAQLALSLVRVLILTNKKHSSCDERSLLVEDETRLGFAPRSNSLVYEPTVLTNSIFSVNKHSV